MSDELPNVVEAMSAVMNDVGAVKKTGTGDVPYSFRGIDQVMNALHGALTKHQVVVVPAGVQSIETERLNNGRAQGVVLVMTYRIYGPRGDYIDVAGVGGSVDYSDKAVNQAMSMSYKYALLEAFCIPTEDMQDGDASAPTVENAATTPSTVDMRKLIQNMLDKDERAALREAWKADFEFTTAQVPVEQEGDCMKLIRAYVGTGGALAAPEQDQLKEETEG